MWWGTRFLYGPSDVEQVSVGFSFCDYRNLLFHLLSVVQMDEEKDGAPVSQFVVVLLFILFSSMYVVRLISLV